MLEPFTKMSRERESRLVLCIIEKLKNAPLSREIVADCYFLTQPAESQEKPSTSELWINIIFDNLRNVDVAELHQAQRGGAAMGRILHRIFP